jgi:hypothetical protein
VQTSAPRAEQKHVLHPSPAGHVVDRGQVPPLGSVHSPPESEPVDASTTSTVDTTSTVLEASIDDPASAFAGTSMLAGESRVGASVALTRSAGET